MALSSATEISLISREEIIGSLRTDPLLKSGKDEQGNENSASIDYDSILRKDFLLSQQLHDATSLRSISGLILEFKANFELVEFENCYYSLQSLRKKLRENSCISKQSFSFQQSVLSHVDAMHLQLVEKLLEIMSQGFWQVTDDTITFRPHVEFGDTSDAIDYISFMTFVEQQYFPDRFLDPNLWVIRCMKVGPSQDAVIYDLNIIFKDYLNLKTIIETIKKFLFAKNKRIIWENQGNTKSLQLRQGGANEVDDRIANINNVTSFLHEDIAARNDDTIAKKLGPLLAMELLQTIKSNAYTVLHCSASSIRGEVSLANEKLKQLAESSNWLYHSADIEHLLNDDQVQNSLLLDGIFEQYIGKMRSIFRNPTFKALETVHGSNSRSKRTSLTETHLSKTKEKDNKAEDNGPEENWEWGDDGVDDNDGDGWANELAIDFDDNSGATPRKARRLSAKSGSDEPVGWDEEMEINFDEISSATLQRPRRYSQKSSRSQRSQKSEAWGWDLDFGENDEESYSKGKGPSRRDFVDGGGTKVSKMTFIFLSTMEELAKAIEKAGRTRFDEHIYHHKLNVLQTVFFALSTRHFQEDWWQLFVNLRYITDLSPNLTRLKELKCHFLEIYLNSGLKVVTKLIEEQMQQFFIKEKDPSWDILENKLLPFVSKQIIEPLTAIGGEEGASHLLYFYNYFYNGCINDKILTWNVISEKNSENLAYLVSIIYDKTEASMLRENKQYCEYRDKLIIIGQLLQLHLKEIMAMFYNGDFYLFSTDELVQWLVLLFADTPLRKSAIEEVYEIRRASDD